MKTILIILAVVMLAAVHVSAQIPRLINYQGVLTDDMGAVVSDGSYNMTFRLYDVPSGGSHLWEETIAVNVSKGIFNTTLGHVILIEETFSEPLYLAIEIDGGGELSPRRLFTANAYAFSARAIYGVTNIFPADGQVGIGTMTPEAPLHIYTSIADANTPTLLIQNTGDQSIIDFKMATVTEARIRHNAGYDFYFGTLTNGGVSLRTNDLTRLRIVGDGKVGIGIIGPLERLDVAGAIRLGTTTTTNAGTIRWTGSDFEGYDGSLWNSLTTGGGSGLPPGTSGQTLRHDGAAWVTSANLTNTGSEIGIGTDTPGAELHVYGTTPVERVESNMPTGNAAIEIQTSNGTYDYLRLVKYGPSRSGTTAGGIPLAGLSQIEAGTDAGALMLQTGAMEPMYLVTDNTRRMEITGDGDIYTFSAISGALISMVYGGPSGYYFGWHDDAGNQSGTLESDSDTGGFMSLKRNATADGFLVNGNYLGLEGTRVDILGATTAIAFDASAEGDDSVELPPDALSAPEILDEPGAGYDWRAAVYNLDTGITSVAARTVTVPAAGYVIVWGTAEVQINHTSGTSDWGRFGVSTDVISFPNAQNNDLKLAAGLPTGEYSFPVTVHGLFEVTAAGAYIYHLIGAEYGGVVLVNKSSLTALYIPTAYGPIDALSASYGSAPSDSDPAQERRESEAFNDARLERELAAMRDRIAALESELGNK